MSIRCALILAACAALTTASCATTSSVALFHPVGSGDGFTAGPTFMSANKDWGDAVRPARFTPGIEYKGVKAVEAAIPYGETTVAYSFGGFPPGASVEIALDVNFDFFMQNGFIYLSYLSGRHDATEGKYPRPAVSEGRRHEWIDSVGRFAGEPWPDSTEGWKTIRETVTAGDDGFVSLLLMVNHYTETPPVIYMYFTNPVASARK